MGNCRCERYTEEDTEKIHSSNLNICEINTGKKCETQSVKSIFRLENSRACLRVCSEVWRLETKRSSVSSRLLTFFYSFSLLSHTRTTATVRCVWIITMHFCGWTLKIFIVCMHSFSCLFILIWSTLVVVWQWAYVHFCRLRQPPTKWHDGELKCHNIFAGQQRAVVGTMRKSLEKHGDFAAQSINLEIIKINCLPSNEIIRKFPRIFRQCLAGPPHQLR